jgi:hypothetical protein
MRRDLVTEKVEIDPNFALSADSATKYLDIEFPRRLQVSNWES